MAAKKEEGKYKAKHRRYFAKDDFEGAVGLATIKFRKGFEIKDTHLALTLLEQDLPIEVKEEEVELVTTYPDKYKGGAN